MSYLVASLPPLQCFIKAEFLYNHTKGHGELVPCVWVSLKALRGQVFRIESLLTEYGALFNKLNDERAAKGLSPLKTAMEVLIDAMQSDELDIKDKAKIADKLAPFESSRAPIISIEHVNNVNKEDEVSADDALDDFLQALRKV